MNLLEQQVQRLASTAEKYAKRAKALQQDFEKRRLLHSKHIGIMLRKHRIERRLQQKSLAFEIGLKPSELCVIENGDCPISGGALRKIQIWLTKLTE